MEKVMQDNKKNCGNCKHDDMIINEECPCDHCTRNQSKWVQDQWLEKTESEHK
jgi:hypothetical protein